VHASKKDDSPIGLLLIVGYLFCDGFTSTLQERNFKNYKMSIWQQMLYINLVSSAFSLIGTAASVLCSRCDGADGDGSAVLTTSGELLSSLWFTMEHPRFAVHAFGLSLCSCLGQIVIMMTVKEFGALVFATVMTTRQFLNILLSCLIYLHPLTAAQWVAVAVVFGAMHVSSPRGRRPAALLVVEVAAGRRCGSAGTISRSNTSHTSRWPAAQSRSAVPCRPKSPPSDRILRRSGCDDAP
jgi:solute carrier family 35 (adenosine 3'-phospho 5'-phosphosulfate transporter), member B2